MRSVPRPEVGGRRGAVERWRQRHSTFGRCRCAAVPSPAPRWPGCSPSPPTAPAAQAQGDTRVELREPAVRRSRATSRTSPRSPSTSAHPNVLGRRLQRRDRPRGLQRRRGQHVPVHAGRRRVRASTSPSTPARPGRSRPTPALSARNCNGVPVTPTRHAAASSGPIGTVPNYDRADLVADGDPALAFGPRPDGKRRLLLRERLAALLRQPRLGAARAPPRSRASRRSPVSPHRQPAGGRRRRRRRAAAAGATR